MRIRPPKATFALLGFLLVASVGTVAYADTSLDWFDGDHPSAADPNRASTALKVYDASGAVVTGGSVNAPLGAFVAADDAVRAGDTYGSLFLHVPDAGLAQGAWTGVQSTGTTKFDVAHPASLNGKPFVVTNSARALTLGDFLGGYPASGSTGDFKDVYELRLRTSSVQGGVSERYASAFVKVTGATWAVTTAPIVGGTGPTPSPTPTPTTPVTTTPTVPVPTPPVVAPKVAPGKPVVKITKKSTAKKAGKATITVKPSAGGAQPTGKITITIKGKTTKKITTTLSGGKKSVKLPKLKKGTWKVTAAYSGDARYLPSNSKVVSLKVKK